MRFPNEGIQYHGGFKESSRVLKIVDISGTGKNKRYKPHKTRHITNLCITPGFLHLLGPPTGRIPEVLLADAAVKVTSDERQAGIGTHFELEKIAIEPPREKPSSADIHSWIR